MFSGLNLAFFGVSRLQLEVESKTNPSARRVLALRKDSNFLLTTILWGNVGINVLLTILTNSVLSGIMAFLFSTVLITFFGEVGPQAYFSRNPVRMASLLSPVLRIYQVLLYPVAKPTSLLLDWWLGKETPQYFREHVFRDILVRHAAEEESELGWVESIGALNFLDIDELSADDEGEAIDPKSIIQLPVDIDLPRFPKYEPSSDDAFLQQVNASGRKWIILTDLENNPKLLLDADEFLRAVLFESEPVNPYDYCHRPIIIRDPASPLDHVIRLLQSGKRDAAGVIEDDVVLVWLAQPKIITGADILQRLLNGIR